MLYRLSGLLVLILIIEGCTSLFRPTVAMDNDSNAPYGFWLLLNAKDIQDDLLTGCLYVGENPSDKAEGFPCNKTCNKKNSYVLTLLEKNFGYGCTDFVGVGTIEYHHDKQQWFLVSEGDTQTSAERMRAERHGLQLFIFLSNGTKLVFEQSTSKDLEDKMTQACEQSYPKNRKKGS